MLISLLEALDKCKSFESVLYTRGCMQCMAAMGNNEYCNNHMVMWLQVVSKMASLESFLQINLLYRKIAL